MLSTNNNNGKTNVHISQNCLVVSELIKNLELPKCQWCQTPNCKSQIGLSSTTFGNYASFHELSTQGEERFLLPLNL